MPRRPSACAPADEADCNSRSVRASSSLSHGWTRPFRTQGSTKISPFETAKLIVSAREMRQRVMPSPALWITTKRGGGDFELDAVLAFKVGGAMSLT
eukprot:5788509-Prymnesium_polylepis.1